MCLGLLESLNHFLETGIHADCLFYSGKGLLVLLNFGKGYMDEASITGDTPSGAGNDAAKFVGIGVRLVSFWVVRGTPSLVCAARLSR